MKLLISASSLLLLTLNIHAECQKWDMSLETEEHVIGQIVINAQNVFNPENDLENKSFHRVANGIRIQTKKHVIERDLLFVVGDILDAKLLQETERILRARPYIKDAKITPVSLCNDGVIISVVTKDNWTLQPGISYGFSGGRSKYSFELQEKNLFGLGKSLEFKYKKGLVRTENSIEYYDPSLFGSSKTLLVGYQDNSDGNLKHFNLNEPFKSLNTPFSWEIDSLDWELVNPLYESGRKVDEIGQFIDKKTLRYGKLLSAKDDSYHRINFGYTSDKSTFFNSLDFPDTPLPENRLFEYPWVSYEYIDEEFIEKTNFKSMGRTEDIALGHHLFAQLGYDSQQSNWHYDMRYSKGLLPNEKNLFKFNVYSNGILNSDQNINTHTGLGIEWHHFQSPTKTFYAATALDLGENLFAEKPQYLGSETGLRGYPFRYLNGDNVWLTTLEQRYFYNWYPLRTFQFASALFFDAGRVWSDGTSGNTYSNVGIGFRLVPTRTSGGQVIHFDVAFPTESKPGLDSVQFQIRAKKSF
ncbi:MAG: BamA/TamA family outer membrane protein [Xanthomonadales bacterium]|nr:BamA/TamA family outer membrane protein [Xanthomonadales bacterium]